MSIPVLLLLMAAACSRMVGADASTLQQQVQATLAVASAKLNASFQAVGAAGHGRQPDYTPDNGGAWAFCACSTWTVGFFTGCLWEMQQLSVLLPAIAGTVPSGQWTSMAQQLMPSVATYGKLNVNDLGFMEIPFSTSVQLHGASQDPSSVAVLLQGAATLSSHFVAVPGVFRSRVNKPGTPSYYVEVIMDDMMNLELPLQASKLPGGNPTWYTQAVSHARTTAANHFRPDNSTYHHVIYSSVTGQVLFTEQVQGYADWSCWSRGQAWAIAGFTMVHRETGLAEFLTPATRAADYFLAHLPADQVPLWDFQAPDWMLYKDTSAAAVAAAGLIELDAFVPGRGYGTAAVSILSSLMSSYVSGAVGSMVGGTGGGKVGGTLGGTASYYASILTNGTSTAMLGGFNQGLIYGDYYFLKALRLLQQQQQQQQSPGPGQSPLLFAQHSPRPAYPPLPRPPRPPSPPAPSPHTPPPRPASPHPPQQ